MSSELLKIGKAITVLVDEHGSPNTFTASEIGAFTGTTPRRVGTLIRRNLDFMGDYLAHHKLALKATSRGFAIETAQSSKDEG